MGAFRFSDVERNIIVASTNLEPMSKSPLTFEAEKTKQRKHYSQSEHGVDVYGSANVYVDNMVTNENVRFLVKRVYPDF